MDVVQIGAHYVGTRKRKRNVKNEDDKEREG